MPDEQHPLKTADFVRELQSSGRYAFSLGEAVEAVGGSIVAVRSAVRRLKTKGRLASPCREYFVIVPLEYRSMGSLPATWFIDDLMRFLGQPYYVGLLSAAEIHGAAHQRPQVFQVVTSEPTAPMTAGRVRIEFFRKRRIDRVATTRVRTQTGFMTVATPAATAFDLLRHVRAAGHLNNVATVLTELGETIAPDELAAAAEVASTPEVQRAGYLFALVGHEALAASLEGFLATRRVRPALLRPDAAADSEPIDDRWRLVINEQVEPDL